VSSCEQVWYYTSQDFWILAREPDFASNPNTKDLYQELLLHAAETYAIKLELLEEEDNSNCTYDYVQQKYPSQPPFVPIPTDSVFYSKLINFIANYIYG
jgi:hypothetical protein